MLIVELGGKTLTTTNDRLLIHINGMPMEIKGDNRRVFINGKRVNGWNLPVLEFLGMGIMLSLWYTLLFTEYGMQFMQWIVG